MILASEDIGLANPNALLLANACFDTVHKIGMPEARITLAETTIYLATSPRAIRPTWPSTRRSPSSNTIRPTARYPCTCATLRPS